MGRHRSQSEKTMHSVQEKADAQLDGLNDGYEPLEVLHSWSAGELIIDAHYPDPLGWKRYRYIPDDDLEIAGVRELA